MFCLEDSVLTFYSDVLWCKSVFNHCGELREITVEKLISFHLGNFSWSVLLISFSFMFTILFLELLHKC